MWDLFISHASEDKVDIARPLAEALKDKGLKVWYDEYELRIGDSLRRSIDKGLRESRYVVLILSPIFFEKKWTQLELDGMLSQESAGKERVLPVLHDLDFEKVKESSPILAGRRAISTTDGLDHVVVEIVKKVCRYRVVDHHNRTWDIDVSKCEAYGVPVVPPWLATDPKRMSSTWLAERMSGNAELLLFRDPAWAGGTWFVVDVFQETGEVVNLDQLRDLNPSSPTTTTTPPPPLRD